MVPTDYGLNLKTENFRTPSQNRWDVQIAGLAYRLMLFSENTFTQEVIYTDYRVSLQTEVFWQHLPTRCDSYRLQSRIMTLHSRTHHSLGPSHHLMYHSILWHPLLSTSVFHATLSLSWNDVHVTKSKTLPHLNNTHIIKCKCLCGNALLSPFAIFSMNVWRSHYVISTHHTRASESWLLGVQQ